MNFKQNFIKTCKDRSVFFVRISIIILVIGMGSVSYSQPENSAPKTNGNYKIGVGDVLKIVVPKQEILSVEVRVGNEGTIRIPMLDEDIPAACFTEVELADVINQKYKKYILNPQVYVAVQKFHPNPVAFIGAVNAPGNFDIQRPMRLLDLLAEVKGPASNASENIQIFRQPTENQCKNQKLIKAKPGEEEIIFLPLAETLKGNDNANPFLQAGDIISIAVADEPEEAYIVGNVKSAIAIKLDEPITLSKAIAMAGGTTKDANIKRIKISRQDPKTLSKAEILANLEEINKDNQKDILLQANDIVDVPGPKKSVFLDLFKRSLPILTRGIIPIY